MKTSNVSGNVSHFQSRVMSLILLRRIISNDWEELWGALPEEYKKQLLEKVGTLYYYSIIRLCKMRVAH